MAEPPRARLSATEGRKFGIPVGIAFVALALIMAWRGRETASQILGAVGMGLVLAALVVPTRLGPVHRAWMGLAVLLSRVTTPIFMGVTFYLVVTPIGLLMRLFGRDPMVRRPVDDSYWVARADGPGRRSDLERQF
jgi:hypothetical protein